MVLKTKQFSKAFVTIVPVFFFFIFLAFNVSAAQIDGCAVLDSANTVYYLNTSIINSTNATCINITADNVTLDCQNNIIDGDDIGTDYGVWAYGPTFGDNNTIRNCIITDWHHGIHYNRISNSTIENCTLTSNNDGINMVNLGYNNLINNIIANSNIDMGIYLSHFRDGTITNIVANDNVYGVGFGAFCNNSILKNITVIGNNETGLRIGNPGSGSASYNTIWNVTANLNKVGIGVRHTSIHNNFSLLKADSNGKYGIYLKNCYANNFSNVNATNNGKDGFYFEEANQNYHTQMSRIEDSFIYDNLDNGIHLSNFNYTYIGFNTIYGNVDNGIYLNGEPSGHNNITENDIYNNTLTLSVDYAGIKIFSADFNRIINNTIYNNSNGSGILLIDGTDNNTITNNTVEYNGVYGLLFTGGAGAAGTGNTVDENTFCYHPQIMGSYHDIADGDSNTGDENTCDLVYNWNDTGDSGCSYACGGAGPDTTDPVINITSPTSVNITHKEAGTNVIVYYNYTEANPKNLTLHLLNQSNDSIAQMYLSSLTGGTGQTGFSNILIPGGVTGLHHIFVIMYDNAGNNGTDKEMDSVNVTPTTIACGSTITLDTTLTDDLLNCQENGLLIGADHITLNCDNHIISGNISNSFFSGIYSEGKNNITIKNCRIENYSINGNGIYINQTDNSLITNNTVINCGGGVVLENSSHDNITNNAVNYTQWAIALWQFSDLNNVLSNDIYHTSDRGTADDYNMSFAIELMDSADNLVEGNYIFDTSAGGANAMAAGIFIASFGGDNFANDNQIISNEIYNSEAEGGYVGMGLTILHANSTFVSRNIFVENELGIYTVSNSFFSNITNNFLNDNFYFGVFLHEAYNSTLKFNEIYSSARGIYLVDSALGNVVDNNALINNIQGISLLSSPENTIVNNLIDSFSAPVGPLIFSGFPNLPNPVNFINPFANPGSEPSQNPDSLFSGPGFSDSPEIPEKPSENHPPLFGATVRNDTLGIDIAVEDNLSSDIFGTFSIGGANSTGIWHELSYGWPDPWEGTYLTVSVNGVNYTDTTLGTRMNNYILDKTYTANESIVTRWLLPEDIVITQTFELAENSTRILLSAENNGSTNSHEVGLRLYIDTKLGDNDGSPIYIPGVGIKENETTFIDPVFIYWKAYDDPITPTITSMMVYDINNLPDKVILADWGNSVADAWNYTTNSSESITYDSAVIAYWNPEILGPGANKVANMSYGTSRPLTQKPFSILDITTNKTPGEFKPMEAVQIKIDVLSVGADRNGTINISVIDNSTGSVLNLTELIVNPILASNVGTVLFNWTIPHGAEEGDVYDVFAELFFHNETFADNKTVNSVLTIFEEDTIGISIYESDYNLIVNNTLVREDVGINLNNSDNNLIYNNNFTNINNVVDNGNNYWNITKTFGTNIIGGIYLGGNSWSNYTGSDTDGDGLGNTNLPHNGTASIDNGGDWHPLVEAGVLCLCEDCEDCTDKLNNATCTEVRLTENITDHHGTCIDNPANFSNKIFNCQNNIIDGEGIGYGVFTNEKSNNIIRNCIITNFSGGIYLNDCNDSQIISNIIRHNGGEIIPPDSHGVGIMLSNGGGITILHSTNIQLISNTLRYNNHSIELYNTTNSVLLNNTAGDSRVYGVYMQNNSGINISKNIITNNTDYGVYLTGSDNNLIFNNFFNNTNNVYGDGTNNWNTTKTPGTNIFGGAYLGGNYWSDYNGKDTDGDGLGNTNLPWQGTTSITNGGDWYPLVESETEGGDDDTGRGSGRGSSSPPKGGSDSACGNGICEFDEDYLTCPEDCSATGNPPGETDGDTHDLGNLTDYPDNQTDINTSSTDLIILWVKGERHVIQIAKLTNGEVILWIWSDPTKVIISLGASEQFDLDGNGYSELEITYLNKFGDKAHLSFKEIDEATKGTGVTNGVGFSKVVAWILFWILLVVIAAAVFYYFMKKKKKDKLWGFR